MDRKAIIAIVLSIVGLVWYQYTSQKQIAQYQAAHKAAYQAEMEKKAAAAPEKAADGAATAATLEAAKKEAEKLAQTPEVKKVLTVGQVEYTFTNYGGGISSVKLLNHEGPVKGGERMILNQFATHPIGALLHQPADKENEVYEMREEPGKVIFERTNANGLQIKKTYTLPTSEKGADAFLVGVEVEFKNRGAGLLEKVDYHLFVGSIEPIHARDYSYYTGLDWDHQGDVTRIDLHWFDASSFLGFERSPAKSLYRESSGGVNWAAVKNQYFTSLIEVDTTPGVGVWAVKTKVKVDGQEADGIEAAITMPGFKLQEGETLVHKYRIFSGPKEYGLLKELGKGEAEVMNFGMFKWICILLLSALNWIAGWTGSYAIAIIVLTFIVRGLLWPVIGKSNASMKKMQAIHPLMTEIREKYKDDPARMNQETLKLYRDYGVNPLAGCGPMLIQIPIFFGFYSMLGTSVELRNSHFLWVQDLSLPDTVGHLFGFPINILPLLMAATMLLQMQLTPKSGDAMQQKVFMLMPLIFVFFTYNFASALALYYTVQNILSIVQLYMMRGQKVPTLAEMKAAKKTK